jgi:hypothetical protein
MPKPFIGTVDVTRKTTLFEQYSNFSKTYGSIFLTWLGTKPVVVIQGSPPSSPHSESWPATNH